MAVASYFKAHRFITRHHLWKWIIIPGILYMLLFVAGIFTFWVSSDAVVSYFTRKVGIDRWLHLQSSGLLSFIFLMSEMIIRLVLIFFYFSLFKYLFLIIGSPLFAYLSEKTEAIMSSREFPFSFQQLLHDMYRGVKLAVRNTLWQAVFTITILLISFIPFIGWASPMVMLFVECYYYGFAMLDYSCERNKLSSADSIEFIGRHKGLAIGNGMMFYLMHLVPVIGWIFAPAYAVVAATISLHDQIEKT
jgi:CysZ protein